MATGHEIQEISSDQPCKASSDLHARIAVAAYYKAERRAFIPGHDLDDWLGAEQEVLLCEGIIHCPKPAVKEPS